MKTLLLLLLLAGTLTVLAPSPANADDRPAPGAAPAAPRTAKATKAMRAVMHKSGLRRAGGLRRAWLVAVGLEASKKVVSPEKRDWRLHVRQTVLRHKARHEARARQRRCVRALN